jgi:hypothetical protein
MMRYIFNLALKWEVPGVKANPCKGIPLMEENNKMERYLSLEEAERLYGAVCKSENTMLQFIVPMLILTGARKRKCWTPSGRTLISVAASGVFLSVSLARPGMCPSPMVRLTF